MSGTEMKNDAMLVSEGADVTVRKCFTISHLLLDLLLENLAHLAQDVQPRDLARSLKQDFR